MLLATNVEDGAFRARENQAKRDRQTQKGLDPKLLRQQVKQMRSLQQHRADGGHASHIAAMRALYVIEVLLSDRGACKADHKQTSKAFTRMEWQRMCQTNEMRLR